MISKVRAYCAASIRLAAGLSSYALRRITPPSSYQALVRLFCLTRGASNDLLARFVSMARPPYPLPAATGILGELGDAEVRRISREIDEKGYYVFPERLSQELCDRLTAFAQTTPCAVRRMSGEDKQAPSQVAVYERNDPRGVAYDVPLTSLLNNPEVQALLADPSILAIAQAYLGSQPAADIVAMWWLTAFKAGPDDVAAQRYHFDMDRIKWLKVFFYLSDVTEDTAPHSFVEGSHRKGGIPSALLDRGYVRLGDDEVAQHYPADKFIEFTGRRGTIILEDTRGLHKGKHVVRGERLLLQFQFSNSLFGSQQQQGSIETVHDPGLAQLIARFPRLYANFRKRST